VSAGAHEELHTPYLDNPVSPPEFAWVRAVQWAIVAVTDEPIDGAQPPLEELNALAEREPLI
jgi:hypothetical protein